MNAPRGCSRTDDGDVVMKMSLKDFDLLLRYLGRAAETLTESELKEALEHMNRLKGESQSFSQPELEAYIVCPNCGWQSFNRNDIAQRYCGNCHAFHSDRRENL